MSRTSNHFAGVLVALFTAGSAGTAFAQQSGNGGGGGGIGGGGGGGATTMPAAYSAVVPNNTSKSNNQRPRVDGAGCVNPTEGIRGPRSIGPCGPH